MAGAGRSRRGAQRRRLGQNFLRPGLAEQLVAEAGLKPGDRVIEIGPGSGALTFAMLARGIDVVAVELDRHWAGQLRARAKAGSGGQLEVVQSDFLSYRLPDAPFRVVGSLPFSNTSAILAHLLDDPGRPLVRADLIVQWEVARKRAASPPATLRSAVWAPFWSFTLGRRIPAADFRPVPRVDGGVLVVERRDDPVLPPVMAGAWARFVRAGWPFEESRSRGRRRRRRSRPNKEAAQ